jgi:hypothetical protein
MFGTEGHNCVKEFLKTGFLLLLSAVVADGGGLPGTLPQWGVNGHPFSQTGYFDVPLEAQVRLVAETGATWYRVDVSTEDFAASTARLDELLGIAARHGVALLPILVSSTGARSRAATPEQIRASAFSFGRLIAGRYKGRITHWELDNELDDYALVRKGDTTRKGVKWQWGEPDGSSPDDYEEGRYQRAKAEILGLGDGVRAADPGSVTIVDTAGWLHYGFIERLSAQDHVPFDILSWHWYSEMGDISNVQGRLDLVAYLRRYGKPLWLTEIGRRGGSAGGKDQEVADFMSRDVARLAANPGIGGIFLYELLDEPYFGESGESHYGLVNVGQGEGGKWIVTGKKAAFGALESVIGAGLAAR